MKTRTTEGFMPSLTLLPLLLFSVFTIAIMGQPLSDKLDQKIDGLPKSNAPLEQLIEISRRYQIPMGIEWVEPVNEAIPSELRPLSVRESTTVRDMIMQLVESLPAYEIILGDSLIYIAQKQVVADPKNFLNLRLPEIRFSESVLGDAEGILRRQIRMTLNPGKYAGGWNGGYGYSPEKEGKERKITLSFRNATIREILNGLVAAHGNSAWVVRLVTTKEMQGLKYYEQGPLNSGQRVTNDFYWQLINFSVP